MIRIKELLLKHQVKVTDNPDDLRCWCGTWAFHGSEPWERYAEHMADMDRQMNGSNDASPIPYVKGPKPVGPEMVEHPQHYGGDTTYEAIKVMFAWGMGFVFCKATILKYIRRLGEKPGTAALQDAKKIRQYAQFIIDYYEGKMPEPEP